VPTRKDRPRKPARVSGQWPALGLAVAVHVAFIAVLVASVRWQNTPPEPVTAELYAAPAVAPVAREPTPPPPPPEPQAKPEPEPKPEPKPLPKPEPAPPPKPVPRPEPKVEKPDPRAADIALKEKQETERRKREQAERDKRDREVKEAQKRETEKKRQDEQKRVAEARERQVHEAEALKAQATRERRAGEADALRAQAEREAQVRAQQQQAAAAAAARARAFADYRARLQGKIRGNVILPPEIPGNPEALFEVVQLPTGEIIEVKLLKPSGVRAYDEAVERAIRKSSPLPRPEQPDLWQRELKLTFRPRD